uniref:Uncharacterized protein n=1 Tax=Arundo donax TaxID=35708 RepID=A0A0A9CGE2_ARUDO
MKVFIQIIGHICNASSVYWSQLLFGRQFGLH